MPDDKYTFDGFPENEEFEPSPKMKTGGSLEELLGKLGFGPGMNKPEDAGIKINLEEIQGELDDFMADQESLLADFIMFMNSKNSQSLESIFPGITSAINNEELFEYIEENILPEMTSQLNSSMKESPVNFENIFQNIFGSVFEQTGFKDMLFNIKVNPNQEEKNEEEKENFELGNSKYLFSNLGNFTIKPNSNIYEKFKNKYGDGPIWESSIMSGIKILTTFEKGIESVLNSISSFKYVTHTESYLLSYCSIDKENMLGFFIGFIVNDDDEIVGFVPEFGNSLDYSESADEVKLYSSGETTLINDKGVFTEMDIEKLIAGIEFMLVEHKRPLLSLSQFGKVTNKRISTSSKSSRYVEIGTVTDNNSSEAILFKKDMDIPVEENEFRFALRFNEELSDVVRNVINDKMLLVDINESLIAQYNELKCFKGENGTIIFLDVTSSNLEKIIFEELRNRKGFI